MKSQEEYLIDIKNNYNAFMNVPKNLMDDKTFILNAIEVMHKLGIYQFSSISDKLKDDKEIALKMVASNYENISRISARLMKDSEIALACLGQKGASLEYLHYDLVDELKANNINTVENAIKYLEVLSFKNRLQQQFSDNNVSTKKTKI